MKKQHFSATRSILSAVLAAVILFAVQPTHACDPATEKARYLFVSKRNGDLLVTPIGHGYGLAIRNGKATDGQGAMDAEALELYLEGKGSLPEWKEDRKR